VFKKTATRPLPPEAEIFVRKGDRFARWKDRRGKTRTAPLTVGRDGSERIVTESPYYVAKYRDGGGVVQVVPTGCRDETAARRVLADLERKAELVRAGVMSAAEAAIGDHQAAPLHNHLDAYLLHLEASGVSAKHLYEVRRQLRRLADDCGFSQLADLDAAPVERRLVQRAAEGMSGRTRNTYLAAALAFANWCVEDSRLAVNPFGRIARANEEADRRRTRRALDDDELVKLLDAARRRPLLDAMTIRRGKRKVQAIARLSDAHRQRLELLGRERALVYKTFLLTGLRRGELASITVGQLQLDGPVAFLALDAGDEKSREGNDIPLRDDLAADLRDWLADKLRRLQEEARQAGEPIPARLPPNTLLFAVPVELVKILNRDLRLAGIAKRDDRGRTLDVHALRHTFGTHLSKSGVAPRVAQAAMRHSTLDLTMNVYTDPKLLDVGGALDALPPLPLERGQAEGEAVQATGTDDGEARTVAPAVAPTTDNRSPKPSLSGNPSSDDVQASLAVSGCPVNDKGRLSCPDSRPLESGRPDSNRRRPAWEIGQHPRQKAAKPLQFQQFTRFGPRLQARACGVLRKRGSAEFPQKSGGRDSLRGRTAERGGSAHSSHSCGITSFMPKRRPPSGPGVALPSRGRSRRELC
jgi:integrase